MKNKILVHFKKADPIIYKILKKYDFELFQKPKNSATFFTKLCHEIISQQLAGKAARAIGGRFSDLFENKKISPARVLELSEQDLRNVGMSWAKARYVRDLAQKTNDQEVILDNLHKQENKKVINELVKVKGIGPWTAEMFLIFSLGKEDVFSYDDLGLKKALQKLYQLNGKPNEKQAQGIASKWSPYKSYACLALWKSIDS